MKKVRLYYREMHIWKDTDFHPLLHTNFTLEDDEKVEIPVIDGVAYSLVFRNYYEEVLAALRDTPEELAKNPDVKLVYIKNKEL